MRTQTTFRQSNYKAAAARATASGQIWNVGDRILYQGERGTVRFAGMTMWEEEPGEWIGIELDTANGHHDGRVDGVRYFQAARKRSALFVRSRDRELHSLVERPAKEPAWGFSPDAASASQPEYTPPWLCDSPPAAAAPPPPPQPHSSYKGSPPPTCERYRAARRSSGGVSSSSSSSPGLRSPLSGQQTSSGGARRHAAGLEGIDEMEQIEQQQQQQWQ
eukprot:426026-Prymnesium_polylepis.1